MNSIVVPSGSRTVNDALSGVRTGLKSLRFTTQLSSRTLSIALRIASEIIHDERDVTKPTSQGRRSTFALMLQRREIFEQFDLCDRPVP